MRWQCASCGAEQDGLVEAIDDHDRAVCAACATKHDFDTLGVMVVDEAVEAVLPGGRD